MMKQWGQKRIKAKSWMATVIALLMLLGQFPAARLARWMGHRRIWAGGVLVLILSAGLLLGGVAAQGTYECTDDTDGANDVPGQKDLTRFCFDSTSVDPLIINWNWDETLLTGENTGDGCALFDTDDDGLANYALCNQWYDGQSQSDLYPKLYACSDQRPTNCTDGVEQTLSTETTCTIADAGDDPFPDGAAGATHF